MMHFAFRLYVSGIDVHPMNLYPKVEYPVPRGTLMISPLVKWDHSQAWPIPTVEDYTSGG